MKRALLLLLLPAASLFAADSWPSVPFTTVRAYSWPKRTNGVILPETKLAPGVINKKGTLLTADQVHRLQVAVAASHRRRKVDIFACYYPQNAFVFYNVAEKPVAYLELCFSCLGNRSQPPIPNHYPNYLSLAAIFEELKLPLGPYTTAKAFRKARLNQ